MSRDNAALPLLHMIAATGYSTGPDRKSKTGLYYLLLANLRTSLTRQQNQRDVRLHGARTRTRRRVTSSTRSSEPGFEARCILLQPIPFGVSPLVNPDGPQCGCLFSSALKWILTVLLGRCDAEGQALNAPAFVGHVPNRNCGRDRVNRWLTSALS